MRTYFFLLVFIPFRLIAQPIIEWQHSYGGTSSEMCFGSCKTFDGGYITVGRTYSNDGDIPGTLGGSMDAWVVRCNSSGNPLWKKTIGGSSVESANSVIQTSDSGFIIGGFTASTDSGITGNHGGGDAYLVRLDKYGGVIWQRTFGGAGFDNVNSIISSLDGGYVIAGNTSSTDGQVSGFHGGLFDSWIVKVDDTGAILWQQALGGSGSDNAYAITQTKDTGYLVVGYTTSNDGDVSGYHLPCCNYDLWTIKLNRLGTLQWQKCFGGTGWDFGYSIIPAWGGGYMIAGSASSGDGDVSHYYGGSNSGGDMWLLKIDDTGRIEWEKTYGGSNNDLAAVIQRTSDSGYVMAGWTESYGDDVLSKHDTTDYWVVKVNDAGKIMWQKCVGGSGGEKASSILQADDNGFIVSGYTNSSDGDVTVNDGSSDIWTVKLNMPVGTPGVTYEPCVKVFPNPASDRIIVELPFEEDVVCISIYDPAGKEYLRKTGLNTKTASLPVLSLPAGLYFLTITTRGGTTTHKVVKAN